MSTLFPKNIKDPYWDNVHPGMMGRIKHRLIIIRHCESTSNRELTKTGQTNLIVDSPPNLTDIGYRQAEDISKHLEEFGLEHFDNVFLSPQLRVYQTAHPILSKLSSDVRLHVTDKLREKSFNPSYYAPLVYDLSKPNLTYDLSSVTNQDHKTLWYRIQETNCEFIMRVKELICIWKSIGSVDDRKQSLVFTHSHLMNKLMSPDSTDMFFHLLNGSYIIMDIDEYDNLNIHAVNYAEHLSDKTGGHHPLLSN
jgi:broad specificity phosphatase PhoE